MNGPPNDLAPRANARLHGTTGPHLFWHGHGLNRRSLVRSHVAELEKQLAKAGAGKRR